MPNLKNVDPAYLNTEFDPGNKYSVPYAMSTTIIGYNEEKMKELGLPTDTWAVIFDPKYLEKVKGRVTVLDSRRAVRGRAQISRLLGERRRPEALGRGRDADQEGEALLGSVQRLVLYQGAYRRQHLARARLLERYLSGEPGCADSRPQVRVRHGMPKEGAVLAVDTMVIHKNAPRPDLALKFMNFMLEGRNSAELTNLIGSGNPNPDAASTSSPRSCRSGDLPGQGLEASSSSSRT